MISILSLPPFIFFISIISIPRSFVSVGFVEHQVTTPPRLHHPLAAQPETAIRKHLIAGGKNSRAQNRNQKKRPPFKSTQPTST